MQIRTSQSQSPQIGDRAGLIQESTDTVGFTIPIIYKVNNAPSQKNARSICNHLFIASEPPTWAFEMVRVILRRASIVDGLRWIAIRRASVNDPMAGLESPANPQTGKSALRGRATFSACRWGDFPA